MVIFREKDHSYINAFTKERLCSVTQRIKQFEETFDEDKWSGIKAEEYGRDQETVLRYWEYLRTVSSIKGSFIHLFLENIWQHKIIDIQYPKYIESLPPKEYIDFHQRTQKCIMLAKKFFEENYERFSFIAAEKIVHNEKYAGQIDNISLDKSIDLPRILDYKTDKAIEYYNQYQSFKDFLSHLSQCNFNKYSLQTYMYKELLDFETAPPIVVWINENNDTYKLIDVKDCTIEAKKLIQC